MGVKAFTDALRTLLTTEQPFVAELEALIGTTVVNVLKANTPWAQIAANQLPCFVLEQGDGQASPHANSDASGLTIGLGSQAFASDMDVCVLWNETSREAAADQRAQLPDLFAQLLMRNPQPGDIDGAWLQQWVPDQGVLHPRQCWMARIHAEYMIQKNP